MMHSSAVSHAVHLRGRVLSIVLGLIRWNSSDKKNERHKACAIPAEWIVVSAVQFFFARSPSVGSLVVAAETMFEALWKSNRLNSMVNRFTDQLVIYSLSRCPERE